MPEPGKFIDLNTGAPVDEAVATPEQLRAMELFRLVDSWRAEGVDWELTMSVLAETMGAVLSAMEFVETVNQIVMQKAFHHAVKSLVQHQRARLLERTPSPPGRAN